MENNDYNEATALVLRDFELAEPNAPMSEEETVSYLAEAIAYMIEHKMDFLLSLLYRLDVDEHKINRALMPGNPIPANIGLAHLVWNRQKLRIATKKAYKQHKADNWDWDME
jgi:hypothetical protein